MPTAAEVHDWVRGFALSLPEAYEDFPWGESVAKVNKKVFVFLGGADEQAVPGFSVKLPASAEQALALPGAAPTGYGLGRAGWVSIRLVEGPAPLEVLLDWVEESYRAVAPKRLAAGIERR